MKKYISTLISALIIGSGAYVQMATAADATPASPSAASMAKADSKRDTMNEQHIKDLHAKLKITADQEKLWGDVANTMRDNAKEVDKIIDKRESNLGTATAVDDLNAYGDIAQAHADSVKKTRIRF